MGSTKCVSFTFKRLSMCLTLKHLSPVGVSMVARALSVCKTGITVLLWGFVCFNLFYVAPKYIVSQICFYKRMKVSVPA